MPFWSVVRKIAAIRVLNARLLREILSWGSEEQQTKENNNNNNIKNNDTVIKQLSFLLRKREVGRVAREKLHQLYIKRLLQVLVS